MNHRCYPTLCFGEFGAAQHFCQVVDEVGNMLRGAFFTVRQHANLPWMALDELHLVGQSDTGKVFEQSVQIVLNDSLKIILRCIVVEQLQPTRDGHTELAILSTQ